MEKFFMYTKSTDDSFNSLVEGTLDLARAYYDDKKIANDKEYKAKNKELLEAMGRKGVEGVEAYAKAYEVEGLNLYKRPMVRNNSTVRDNFNAVVAQVINAIIPEVVND